MLGVAGGGAEFSPPESDRRGLRGRLESLLDRVEPHGAGLCITVDEVQSAARDELRQVAATFQHLVTDQREVALAVAGLPSAVSDLVQDDVLTFLRRATPFELADVELSDVRAAMLTTVAEAGRSIRDEALDLAVAATGGYPFMIQLVGYHVWRKASGEVIDGRAAREGIPAASKRVGSTVHDTALGDLSDVDRTYLLAMAQDPGPSSTSEIAERLGESVSYAGVYRRRLLEAGMIEDAGYRRVDFAVPFLREYLREHAARYAMVRRRRRARRSSPSPPDSEPPPSCAALCPGSTPGILALYVPGGRNPCTATTTA